MKSISELRQDIVSGDWVVIATGRAKRPDEFAAHTQLSFRQPKKTCPFEDLSGRMVVRHALHGEAGDRDWWVAVIPNKYPAFGKGTRGETHAAGPYQWTEGIGFHEVVVTRDHGRSIALMSVEEVEALLRAYQERYRELAKDTGVKYISIFHNHGRLSGATIAHPHSQIIAIPVIPPDVGRSVKGSAAYFHHHKKCVHCVMIDFEMKARERIIYENDHCVIVAPYASKTAFEMRIFPKNHRAHFEKISVAELRGLADGLQKALGKLAQGLRNPDYNFFLHTAPMGIYEEFHHYHWHFEILPKTAIWAGFEIGTGIEISTITPEAAARFLHTIKL